MYLNFYDLKKEPFNITPDPELLFLSPSHKEALAAAIYGVTQRKGFVAIVGEVGVGKTTILRSFLEKMNGQDLKVIYLLNAHISFLGLLRTIYENLGVRPESDDVFELVSGLHRIFLELYKAGTNVVLIIDEAQNLPVETLKSLHMLSNLETSTVKLIQVVFSGQPELEEKLSCDALRQIKQRVVIKVHILPLSRKDTLAYIRHRLLKTARGNTELFSSGALSVIVKHARGVPRVVNTLCDNCLITSYGRQLPRVTAAVARETVADVMGKRGGAPLLPQALAGAFVLGCLALWFAFAPTPRPSRNPTPPPSAPRQITPPVRTQTPVEQPVTGGVVKVDAGVASLAKTTTARVVKRGDTLARIILKEYGFVDRRLISLVKRSNPRITDENVIQEGAVLYLPPLD